ncbi:MAG: endonuclease/exonuclease/phosphatase family protein [Chlamydiales bacterium]|nr:endonuclease/exonuclease/phosphatase family protein [Chlamydiales bacterium]
MKFLFILFCLFGITSQIQATTPEEIETSLNNIKVAATKTVEFILSTPSDQQTFENSLYLWNKLSSQIYKQFNMLHEATKSNVPEESEMATWALEELRAIALDLSQNDNLSHILLSAAKQERKDDSITSFRSVIAEGYIQNKGAKYIHNWVSNSSNEKICQNNELSATTLSTVNLAKDSLPTNVDILCIQEIFYDDVYEVYQLLLGHAYDHIIYFRPCNIRLDLSPSDQYTGGMLIASKYPLTEIQVNDDYLDVIIQDANGPLGHLYVVQAPRDNIDISPKLLHVITAMQEEMIPAILCTNCDLSSNSYETQVLMDTYFSKNTNFVQFNCLDLLIETALATAYQPFTTSGCKTYGRRGGEGHGNYSNNGDTHGYSNHGNYNNHDNYNSGKDSGQNSGRTDVYMRYDTEEGTSAGAKISTSGSSDSGCGYSLSLDGTMTRDPNGHISGTINGKGSWTY